MKIKKIIISILIAILLLSIYLFSGQSGGKSIQVSDNFTGNIINKVASITNKEISLTSKKRLIYKTRFIVRKIAHFTLYFTLGILVYLLLKLYNVKRSFIISIIICFLCACCDEFHQLFVVGRTARFYDCIIDTIGSVVGITILYTISKIRSKKEIKQS